MTTHRIKCDSAYWHKVRDGYKPFEVRRNDRGYQAGDELHLVAIGPRPDGSGDYCNCTQQDCSRRSPVLSATVSYVYAGDPRFGGHGGIQTGWVVLGLVDVVMLDV